MKLNVGVLFGGASVEHEISILSAMQAMDHLDESRYEVIPIYVSKDLKFYQDDACRKLENFKNLDALQKKLHPVSLYAKDNKVWIRSTSRFFAKEKEIDVCLPIMHGTYGEDGSIQGLLRMLDVPFCGSDLLGAVIGQDKGIMKHVLKEAGLPVLDFFELRHNEVEEATRSNRCAALGWPLILKPATLGSSIGIHIVSSMKELQEALQDCFHYDDRVIVEKALTQMREFNCAILGDEDGALTSCVEEVSKEDEILSYHDKYEGGGKSKGMLATSRKIPALIREEKRMEIEQLALQTFTVLHASGVARVDFLMDEAENIYINEINTIPGSLSFYLFEPMGIHFSELLDQLIELALKRQRKQKQMIFSYSSNILSSYGSGRKLRK